MLKQTIPFVDLRGKSLADLLRSYPDKAEALLINAKNVYGVWSRLVAVFLPYTDKKSFAWLKKTRNPFLHEIESFADIVKRPGIATLNLSYEWSCTSGAYAKGGAVELLRVLDWPIKGLGEHAVVALMQGQAGEFYNITWPGMVGMFNGMAPGRFAVAINQAPMRRHKLTFVGDWFKNRRLMFKEKTLPPSHLLRLVFERCKTFAEAKEALSRTPIAMPAIFVLTGTKPGEGCIIERLENAAEVKDILAAQRVTAANHFESNFAGFGKGWWPRALDSKGRALQAESLTAYDMAIPDFSWLKLPMINDLTRLAIHANASNGMLKVQGYNGFAVATECFVLKGEAQEQPIAGVYQQQEIHGT